MSDILFIAYLIFKSKGKTHDEAMAFIANNLKEYEQLEKEMEVDDEH